MQKTTTLANVPVGTTFTIWNRKFTVLDKSKDRVFVLAAKSETSMPFRNEDSEVDAPWNNFGESDIRNYLNLDYLAALRDAGADTDHDLIPFDVELKCTMGQHEYGSCTVKAGLLMLEQYGEYYDIIPLIDDWWWLATPWKTPSRSPHTSNTSCVWYVRMNGDYDYGNGASNSLGVRPSLTLNPFLLVSWEDESYEGSPLSEISTDELLNELRRRAAKK